MFSDGKITLTIKPQIPIAADDILILFLSFKKISLDISCESSAKQTIHMKCQDLLYNKKKSKCHQLQILPGALSFNHFHVSFEVLAKPRFYPR